MLAEMILNQCLDGQAAQMGYRNPTLTEIYAELYLAPGTFPEKSFLSLAHELAKRGLDDHEFGHRAIVVRRDNDPAGEAKFVPRIRCWDRERTRLIQFSPDALYVNLVGEYPGWKAFREHLKTACEAMESALGGPVHFTQIDLVTIDKWKVDRGGFTIGQFLDCSGIFIPKWYSDVSCSSDITLGQGFYHQDGFNRNVNVIVRVSENDADFQITASFGAANSREDFDALMDRLHSESLRCFEALITDRVRTEIMGGLQ